ncbi:MAG: hypothetical protein ACI92S_003235, partial [Planctomycetaceae bacterium]
MINRNLLSATLAVLLTGSCAMAEEHVATIRWSELEAAGKLETGEVIRPSAESPSSSAEELLIVNEAATPLTVHLATIDPTSISKFNYTVSGRVRYENVEQPGYLEMWSVFPDNSRYFSKTLSSSGPTGTIHGTSASREFILPFSSSVRSGTPSKLEINLVLPAQGKVWISPLKLSEFEKSEWADAMTAEGAWWGNRTGNLMGAILGCEKTGVVVLCRCGQISSAGGGFQDRVFARMRKWSGPWTSINHLPEKSSRCCMKDATGCAESMRTSNA